MFSFNCCSDISNNFPSNHQKHGFACLVNKLKINFEVCQVQQNTLGRPLMHKRGRKLHFHFCRWRPRHTFIETLHSAARSKLQTLVLSSVHPSCHGNWSELRSTSKIQTLRFDQSPTLIQFAVTVDKFLNWSNQLPQWWYKRINQ